MIRSLDDVRAYKIVQDSLTDVHVMIVAGAGFPADAAFRITDRYTHLLGA